MTNWDNGLGGREVGGWTSGIGFEFESTWDVGISTEVGSAITSDFWFRKILIPDSNCRSIFEMSCWWASLRMAFSAFEYKLAHSLMRTWELPSVPRFRNPYLQSFLGKSLDF